MSAPWPTRDERPLRALQVCGIFSPLSESFVYDLLCELTRQGVANHVVAHTRENEDLRPFEAVTVVPRRGMRSAGWWRHGLMDLAHGRAPKTLWRRAWRDDLCGAATRLRPDLIHGHFGPSAVAALPAARRLGIPLFATLYGYDVSHLPLHRHWREDYHELWAQAHGIIVLSAVMKREVVDLGCPADKIHVVHLSRDVSAFEYAPRRGPVRHFVSVGRLVEKKGHADAIRAIERVRRSRDDVRLTIVGDGPLRDALAAQIREARLDANVALRPGMTEPGIASVLAEGDAFILCSRTAQNRDREGTPTVLIEAQAAGLPCVSTRHAGIPEMIPSSNQWLLADEGDPVGIADRMARLMALSRGELADLAAAGRAKVEDDFALSTQAGRLRAQYVHALDAMSGAAETDATLRRADRPECVPDS